MPQRSGFASLADLSVDHPRLGSGRFFVCRRAGQLQVNDPMPGPSTVPRRTRPDGSAGQPGAGFAGTMTAGGRR